MAEESEFQKIDPAQLGLLYVRKYFGTGVKVTVDTGVEDRIGTGIKVTVVTGVKVKVTVENVSV